MTERYRLGAVLGVGGVGQVFEAEDTLLERRVALKVLKPGLPEADTVRFRREGLLTAALTHPGIVPVYDIGELGDGRAFIAMRKIGGRTLRDVVEAGDLTLDERLGVFLKVCDAVAYAHAKKVVHRDLKPDNIMVGRFGEVFVMDWGLARGSVDQTLLERLTRTGQIMGTPYYMAPEQAQGKGREARESADVYALGALLYTLLSDAPPFDGADVYEIVRRVSQGKHVPLEARSPDAEKGLVKVVERAMALKPGDRYANVVDLARIVRQERIARTVDRLAVGIAIGFVLSLVIIGSAVGLGMLAVRTVLAP